MTCGEGNKKKKEDFKEVLMRALNTLALGESEEYKDMARVYLAGVFQSFDRPQGIESTAIHKPTRRFNP